MCRGVPADGEFSHRAVALSGRTAQQLLIRGRIKRELLRAQLFKVLRAVMLSGEPDQAAAGEAAHTLISDAIRRSCPT